MYIQPDEVSVLRTLALTLQFHPVKHKSLEMWISPVVPGVGRCVSYSVLPGGRERTRASEVTSVSPVVCWSSWGPGESSGGESGDALETGSHRGTVVRGGLHTSHSHSYSYNTEFLRSHRMAIAWSAPTYSSQRQEGTEQRDVRQVIFYI